MKEITFIQKPVHWFAKLYERDLRHERVSHLYYFLNPLSANPTKWSSTFERRQQSTNCLIVLTILWDRRLKGWSHIPDAYLEPCPISMITSSRPKVLCEKDVLKNFAIFTGKPLCWSLLLITLRPATLLKRLQHRFFL